MPNRLYNKQANSRMPFRTGGPTEKKNKKFPDLSGDGKITKKDILMAKGVIKSVKPTLGLKKKKEFLKKVKNKKKGQK